MLLFQLLSTATAWGGLQTVKKRWCQSGRQRAKGCELSIYRRQGEANKLRFVDCNYFDSTALTQAQQPTTTPRHVVRPQSVCTHVKHGQQLCQFLSLFPKCYISRNNFWHLEDNWRSNDLKYFWDKNTLSVWYLLMWPTLVSGCKNTTEDSNQNNIFTSINYRRK